MKLRALDPLLHPLKADVLHSESKFVENFYQLIADSIEPPYAISIDGLWGTGKTTLMKILQENLEHSGYPVSWFNPWEYRKTQNVVLAFLQCLAAENKDILLKKVGKSSFKMFKVLLELGLDVGVKAITKGTLSLDAIKDQFEDVEEKEKKKLFQGYQNTILTIKDEFVELVKMISQKHENKPVIIFFDDLDRCLPDDTIELLEALKNLFVTPESKSIFICGIDTHIAKRFIDKHYNNIGDMFAINYFRKIFNLTVSMPYPTKIMTLLSQYIEELFDSSQSLDKSDTMKMSEMVCSLCRQAHIVSVRKHMNIITNIFALQKFNQDYHPGNDIILHLIVLKESWEPLFEEIKLESLRSRDFIGTVVTGIISRREENNNILPEQKEYLTRYFANDRGFSNQLLEDLLAKYPTLA